MTKRRQIVRSIRHVLHGTVIVANTIELPATWSKLMFATAARGLHSTLKERYDS